MRRQAAIIIIALGLIGSAACSLSVLDGFADGEAPDAGADAAGDSDRDGASPDAADAGDATGDPSALLGCNAPGLVAYYRFDEGSGSVARSCAGRALDGVLESDILWAPVADGGSAVIFDGGGGVILQNSSTVAEDGVTVGLTFAATVVAVPRTSQNLGRIISKCQPVTGVGCINGLELLLEGRDDGTTAFAMRVPNEATGTSDTLFDLRAPIYDRPVPLAAVYDESSGLPKMRLYVDGALANELVLAAKRHYAGGGVNIGTKGSHNGNSWVGAIDDVRIFSRALSACEVRTLAGKTCP